LLSPGVPGKLRVMKPFVLLPVVAVLLGPLTALAAEEFEIKSSGEFRKVIAADAKLEKLADGFAFTEGPVWVAAEGGYLVFSDIPRNQLKKWTRAGGVTTFREPSQNANGNTLDREGRLVTAEHSGRRVSITDAGGLVQTLVSKVDGKRFSSPNDVVVKSDGTVWFTDPTYGLPKGATKETDGNHVYRYDLKARRAVVVAREFDMPNGLCFSPDEKRLYVADSGKPRHIRVFEVRADGTLDEGRVFAAIEKGGPDGIRCDADGRVWSSSGSGADIFLPSGRLIGKVNVPKGAANLCFGGADGKTLFLTARDALWALPTQVTGAARP
jgi:gluconolactonase